jgi:hypothetical protein
LGPYRIANFTCQLYVFFSWGNNAN